MFPIKIKARLNAYTHADLLDIDRGVETNTENIIGRGTIAEPLDLVYTPDGSTIIKTQEGSKITSVALLDENYESLPQDEPIPGKMVLPNPISASDIRNKFDEVDNALEKNAQDLENSYKDLENSHNILLNKINNTGGYLPSKDFGANVPTQEELTNWALTNLKIEDPLLIPNQTRVKNTYDGNVWILNNMEVDGVPTFEWIDDGSDIVGVATLDTLGLVKSSDTPYRGFIDLEGVISVNGLEDKLNEFNERIISNFDEINHNIGDISDLQRINFTEKDGKTPVDIEALTQAIVNHNERINSNFDETNFLTAELSDFKESQKNELITINDNFSSVSNKLKELDTSLTDLSQVVTSNFDEINNSIGDISDLQTATINTDAQVSNILEVLKDHKERILDNYDYANKTLTLNLSDLEIELNRTSTKLNGLLDSEGIILNNKLPFDIANYVDLSSTQFITGAKTFSNFSLQVPGTRRIQMQAVEGGNLSIKQDNVDASNNVAIETSISGNDQILTLSATKSAENTRLDILSSGFNTHVTRIRPDGVEENTSVIINSAVNIASKEFLYNGVQVATLDDIVDVSYLTESPLNTSSGIVRVFDLNNTTFRANANEIFQIVNVQNGGALINMGFTLVEGVRGNIVEVTESNAGISTRSLANQFILTPNSFYYLYPEQISVSANNYTIQFKCGTNYPQGKGVLTLGASKNISTGLFEINNAKLSGEFFSIYPDNEIHRYYFQNVDLLQSQLSHLTIKYNYYTNIVE